MQVLLVDQSELSLKMLERICLENEKISKVSCFTSPMNALKYIEKEDKEVSLVISEIEMDEMTGIELASRIHAVNENINVAFITSKTDYAFRAFDVDAISYILKPADPVQIEKITKKALKATKPATEKRRIFIRTFGHFDVFVGSVVVRFSSAKAKELLALIVDRRGGVVTMMQAIEALWPERVEDNSVRSLYRNVLQSLRETLQQAGISEIFVNTRNSRSVNITEFECDYYQLLDGKQRGINSFTGEYMTGYAWSGQTLESILEKLENM